MAAVEAMTVDDVRFVFNTPNDQSRPGYLKMGWKQVGRPPTSVRLRSPVGLARMLASRVPAERWPLPVSAGVPAAQFAARPERRRPPRRARRNARVFAPDARPTISPGATASSRSATARSRREAIPRRESRSFASGAAGHAAEAALCEVLVPEGSAHAARHLARAVARATGADYVVRLVGPRPRPAFSAAEPGAGPHLARPRHDRDRAAAARRLGAFARRRRTALSRTAPRRTAPRRTAPRRTAPRTAILPSP